MLSLIIRKSAQWGLLALAALTLQSCFKNKEFEDVPVPPTPSQPTGSIAQVLGTDPNFSILLAAAQRAGITTALGSGDARYTVFAPDNDAFAASGLSLAAVNALPPATLQSILSYHVVPQALASTAIPLTQFNVQMPTLLQLPGGNPLIKNSIFPARSARGVYANNIPVKQADIAAGNSVIHKVAALVMPPSQLIAQIIGADADLSILRAAITRADSGQVGLNRLDSVLRFGVANVTLLAPTNDAFRALFPPGTPDAVIIGALNTPQAFTAQTVRGIVAYHLLGTRAFSVNLPAGPQFVPTLLNGSVPTHPGIRVTTTFTGPMATLVRLEGVGSIVANQAGARVITADLNAVNGLVHKIDRVLMPQ